MSELELWRERWMSSGVPIIPIAAHAKTPLFAWNKLPFSEQWQRAGGDGFRGNIAAVLGNSYVVLDADNKQAEQNISAHLAGLGIKTPVVRTPSGGAHFPLRLSGAPAGYTWGLLSPEVGDGELRVRDCYVLVPCSEFGGKYYRFEYGAPEQLTSMRSVRWQDLLTLIPPAQQSQKLDVMPVRLVKRDMPGRAIQLFEMLRHATKSNPVDGSRYASRSDAEAAIVACLILAGWDYTEIAQAFEAEQPGHYSEAGKQSERYLMRTYQSALGELASNPERIKLAGWYQSAESQAGGGGCDLLDAAVYQALCSVGWQFSSYTVCASQRDLSEHARVNKRSVIRAIESLEHRGMVRKLSSGSGSRGTLYQVLKYRASRFCTISHSIKYIERELIDCSDAQHVAVSPEIWSRDGIGRSSRIIFDALTDEPQSIAQLAKRSGKAWHTVSDALKALEQYSLAEFVGGVGWRRLPVQAEQLERISLKCERLAVQRHERHQRERMAWRERLADAALHKRMHRSKRRRTKRRASVFRDYEPALIGKYTGDMPCSASMREQPGDTNIYQQAEQPKYLCQDCLSMSWYQPVPGSRWRCSVCDDKKRLAQRTPPVQLTLEQVEQRKAYLLAQAAELQAVYGNKSPP